MNARPNHSRPTSTARARFRAPTLSLGLALAFVLLTALLTPLAGAAQDAPTQEPTATEEAPVQEDGDGAADETPDAEETPVEETPVVEETPDAEETPEAEGTPDAGLAGDPNPFRSKIHVYMWECPNDYRGDYERLDANCQRAPDIGFEVYGSANDGSTHAVGESGKGYLSVTNLPAGQYTIREHIPPGYRALYVFCSLGPARGYTEVLTVDGYYEFTLGQYESLTCNWYNVPDDAETSYRQLWIAKSFCPKDRVFQYYTAGYAALEDRCEFYTGNGVAFDLVNHTSGASWTLTTDPSINGMVRLAAQEPGRVTVTEHAQAGYGKPVVFCRPTHQDTIPYTKVAVSGLTVDVEIPSDTHLICGWFNIPTGQGAAADAGDGADPDAGNADDPDGGNADDPDADGGDDPDADGGDDPEAENGTVTVVAHACPAGAGEGDGYEAYAAACTQPVEGVEFKLDGERSGNPGNFPTDAEGRAAWDGLEADHFYLYAEVPVGAGAPVAFCGTGDALAAYAPSATPDADPFTHRVQFDLDEDGSVTCAWFIGSADGAEIEDGDQAEDQAEDQTEDQDGVGDEDRDQDEDDSPTGTAESGSITVYEWLCPAGFDVAAEDTSPWLECAVASEGAALTIAGPDGFADEQATGDDLPGAVRWEGLEAGDYLIDDTRPDGDASGFVLACHGGDVAATSPLHSTESGEPFAVSLADGQHVACLWFTVPAEDPSATADPTTAATGDTRSATKD